MNYRSIFAVGAGALFLAVMFVFFPRGDVKKNDPLNMSESSSPGKAYSEKTAKPIIVDNSNLSAQELRDFAELFEPLDQSRKISEIFRSGQSLLCDVYQEPGGSIGLIFLTVSSHAVENGSPAIMIQQTTMMLQDNGDTKGVLYPSMTIKDYQSGKISIGDDDGSRYSLSLEAFHMGENRIQVMAEFEGTPNVNR